MTGVVPTQVDLAEVRRAYEELDNYQVLDRPRHRRAHGPLRCVVFFSSHGIYFPNTDEQVRARIFRGDRYEWRKNVPPWADRVVFLRDVQKQWFVEGINSRVNSVDGVLALLKDQTAGYETVCVGSSAGGYAAMLFGCLLGAERVVSFSGQFSLVGITDRYPGENPVLERHGVDASFGRYLSLVSLLRQSRTPVFHLYPRGVPEDVEQVRLVADASNVFVFPFRYGGHGVPCYLVNCVDLFGMSGQRLMRLSREISRKDISPLRFSVKVSGWRKTFPYAMEELTDKWRRLRGV